jgi:hypothetical protein
VLKIRTPAVICSYYLRTCLLAYGVAHFWGLRCLRTCFTFHRNHQTWILSSLYSSADVTTIKPIWNRIWTKWKSLLMGGSRGNAVGTATGYGLNGRDVGVRVPVGWNPALRSTQRPIQWVQRAISLRVKRPGREDDHSPPASAEVKPISFHGAVLNYLSIGTTLPYHMEYWWTRGGEVNSLESFAGISRHRIFLQLHRRPVILTSVFLSQWAALMSCIIRSCCFLVRTLQ